jgi:hypothetical protein
MKLRIWHNCLVVGEYEVSDNGLVPAAIGEHEDHVCIDPWNKLAGEQVDGYHMTYTFALRIPKTDAGHG